MNGQESVVESDCASCRSDTVCRVGGRVGGVTCSELEDKCGDRSVARENWDVNG